METKKEADAATSTLATDSPPPADTAPLVLKRGSRIQLGYKKGRVDCVRGGWVKPYDVRVIWDGEKYPQWLIFTTLELDYRRGQLKVL